MSKLNIIIGLFGLCIPSLSMAVDHKYLDEEMKLLVNKKVVTVKSRETLLYKNKTSRYSVENIFDSNLKSAWVTRYSKDDYMDGARLSIEFEKPIYLRTLKIANGYQKNKSTYNENQRVKKLNVLSFMGDPGFDEGTVYSLKDEPAWQEIEISDSTSLFATKTILINIYDSYPGTKYNDLCISGLSFTYDDKSNYKPTQDWQGLKSKILANRTVTNRGWHWERFYALDTDQDLTDWWDFLYFVLANNEEAYELLISIYPISTMVSELLSNDYIPNVNAQLGVKNN